MPEKYTLGEACRRLRISRHTLDKWLDRLQIAPTKHPRDFRYWQITEGEVQEIAEARAEMPSVSSHRPSPSAPMSSLAPESGIRTKTRQAHRSDWPLSAFPVQQRPEGGPSIVRVNLPESPGEGQHFGDRASAARWLLRHGINSELTPKTWPGWRSVELTPEGVLALAISLYDPTNWRITWRLRPCDNPACVCHHMLDPGREPTQRDPDVTT